MKVEVVTRHPKRRVSHKKVMDVVKKCSSSLLPSQPVLSVAFLNDNEMSRINREYTHREGSTDVLSFPLGRDMYDNMWYGEVLISLDRAYKQAREKGVSLIQEVTRLLIHALVHLGGFDHYDRAGFKRMRKMEFDLLLKCL